MRKLIHKFAATVFGRDENGAVAVDWIVLAAATIGFALAVGSYFGPQFNTAVGGLNTQFQNATQ